MPGPAPTVLAGAGADDVAQPAATRASRKEGTSTLLRPGLLTTSAFDHSRARLVSVPSAGRTDYEETAAAPSRGHRRDGAAGVGCGELMVRLEETRGALTAADAHPDGDVTRL